MTIRTPRVVKDEKHWLDPPDWWKKFKPLRWATILLIAGAVGSAFWGGARLVFTPSLHPETEKYLAAAQKGIKLLDGDFSSYSQVDGVTAAVEKKGKTWTQEKNYRPVSERYPPRNLDTLRVSGYEHLKLEGDLTLEFMNGFLYEAYFAPKDAEAYAKALAKNEPRLRRDKIGKADFTDGSLRVATNVELARSTVGVSLGTKAYAIWQDLRLVKLREEWDAAYGSIPVPAQ